MLMLQVEHSSITPKILNNLHSEKKLLFKFKGGGVEGCKHTSTPSMNDSYCICNKYCYKNTKNTQKAL